MKKTVCVLFFLFISLSLYAFDDSLDGSWGFIMGNVKHEIIRFFPVNKDIVIMGTTIRSSDYSEADNTIHIEDFDNDSVIIQYYQLTPDKLLFTLWSTHNITQSITLILSKL